MFHKSKLLARGERGLSSAAISTSENAASRTEDDGSYIELVVSSSKTLVEKSRAEIIDLALKELHEFFPAARNANLLKSTVIKEVNATYSPQPGIDAYRPGSQERRVGKEGRTEWA